MGESGQAVSGVIRTAGNLIQWERTDRWMGRARGLVARLADT
jgi:hypothetical protein